MELYAPTHKLLEILIKLQFVVDNRTQLHSCPRNLVQCYTANAISAIIMIVDVKEKLVPYKFF